MVYPTKSEKLLSMLRSFTEREDWPRDKLLVCPLLPALLLLDMRKNNAAIRTKTYQDIRNTSKMIRLPLSATAPKVMDRVLIFAITD